MNGLLGKKIGMTSYYGPNGDKIPVTVLEVGPCKVVQVKTSEKDGYDALQIGFEPIKEKLVRKPQLGHFQKAGVSPLRYVREFKTKEVVDYKVGSEINVSMLKQGDTITVTGTSSGKGFQGTVKRWNMSLQGASHGTHESKRGSGSIGQCATPAKVFKGKKMSGRMGNDKKTIKNLLVVDVLQDRNIIMVKGSVPGKRNALLKIFKEEVR